MFWWQNWVWFRNGEPTWFFCGSPKSITAICGWVKFLHLKLQFLGLEKISPDHLGMVCFFLKWMKLWQWTMKLWGTQNIWFGFIPETYQIWTSVSWFIQQTDICSINMALWSANKKGDGSKPWRKPMIPSYNTRFSGPCLPRNLRIMRSWEAWNSDLDGPFSRRIGCEAREVWRV